MKNFFVVLNVVLIIAVGILYYLHFKTSPKEEMPISPTVPRGASIVYVNTDSLLDSYNYFKNKKEDFDRKSEQIKRDLTSEGERLQNEASQYQEQAKNMTAEERAKKEDELMTKQQKLMKRKESLLGDLEDQQNKFHDTLYSKLYDFLKKNNKSRNYAFVLGYSKGGGILFANDSLDITKQMVEGLNKEDKK